jgi:CAAX prenyl protease-like protein
MIPIVEELAFRSYLARYLTDRSFWSVRFRTLSPFAVVASSLAFAVVHQEWLLAFLTGVAFALLVRKTEQVVDLVVAHASSNAVIALWVLVTGQYGYW